MAKIKEHTVQEMRGVFASGSSDVTNNRWVQAKELNGSVYFDADTTRSPAYLTVDQARKLARQLNALARRIEIRREAAKPAKVGP